MKSEEMLLQTNMLNKLHESGCAMDMELSIWRPDRKWVDYLFSLENFTVRESSEDIYTFNSKMGTGSFPTVSITLFSRQEDVAYIKKKIKQRKEVNK